MWRSTSGQSWTQAGVLPESPQSMHLTEAQMAHGVGGWVVTATYDNESTWGDIAWWSPDGKDWMKLAVPPRDVLTIVAYDNGFIAGGYAPSDDQCPRHRKFCGTGVSDERGNGVTWVSADGKSWSLVPSPGWENDYLEALGVSGSNLIGLSTNWVDEPVPHGDLWLANLATFGQ